MRRNKCISEYNENYKWRGSPNRNLMAFKVMGFLGTRDWRTFYRSGTKNIYRSIIREQTSEKNNNKKNNWSQTKQISITFSKCYNVKHSKWYLVLGELIPATKRWNRMMQSCNSLYRFRYFTYSGYNIL